MEPDIWLLNGQQQHSTSDHAPSGGGGESPDTTTPRPADGSGPVTALLEGSQWTREDVELATEVARTVFYLVIAYYAIQNGGSS